MYDCGRITATTSKTTRNIFVMGIDEYQTEEGARRYFVSYATDQDGGISNYADDQDFTNREDAKRRAIQAYNESKIVLAS
jgi:homoserine trans-succinylase